MPDLPQHRPLLAGASAGGPDLRLQALPEGHLLQVMGPLDTSGLAGHLAQAGLAGSSIRPAGFRQWFVAGDDALAPAAIAALAAGLKAAGAALSDQSHGRIRIGLSGPGAAAALATQTAVDLDPTAFPEGRSAMTMIGHISAQISRTGPDRYEVTVLRSFAESLWHDLALVVESAG